MIVSLNLDDLLMKAGIPREKTIVMRHVPKEPLLRRNLPWMAEEQHDAYNAYQATQGPKAEASLRDGDWLISCVGLNSKMATFVGLYAIGDELSMLRKELWERPEFKSLLAHSESPAPTDLQSMVRLFPLTLQETFSQWKGRLVFHWPGLERSWYRRAHNNTFEVHQIHETSQLVPKVPVWNEINLAWSELATLPSVWRTALAGWRGIYYIFDVSLKLGYVGAAYSQENILGRWTNYAKSGHGGNKLLKKSNPANLRFTILQRMSPDASKDEVTEQERLWKGRLHTFGHGLNDNF